MIRSTFFAAALAAITIGCQSNPAEMTRLAPFDGGDAQLHRLYEEHHCPLVVIGHGIYLPAAECLGQISSASAVEKQNASAAPGHANAAETESRDISGQTQTHETAGASQSHETAGASQQHETGGASQEHNLGASAEARNFSGYAEQRELAGLAEERKIEGASIPIKCLRRGDSRGFEVLIPNGGDVQYFDGQSLHPAVDGFVPMK